METDVVQGLDSVSLLNSKKNKVEDHESKISSESSTYSNDKYFPFNKQSGIPCIVKVYEEEGKADLVLNERIEVIGFLSLNPALEANWENTDSEDKALHPPPSLVPRIHTISIKKLKHCNPLMNQTVPYGNFISSKLRHLFEEVELYKKSFKFCRWHFRAGRKCQE